jgi:hypothetical protein
MSEITTGSQESAREIRRKLQAELKINVEGAKLGSSMALAINDQWRYINAGINIANAKTALASAKPAEQEENRINLIVAKLEKRQIEGEISQKGVSVPGYEMDLQKLETITRELKSTYRETPGIKDINVDYQVALDLFNVRQSMVNRAS